MRKFFNTLAVMTAVAGLSSCKLDKEQNYVFGYEYFINIQDEADRAAVKNYMDDHFGSKNSGTYFGLYYDAYQKAVEFFNEGIKSMSENDMPYLFSFITEDSDEFILYYVISGEKSKEFLGGYPWNKSTRELWEKEQQGGTEKDD